MPQRDPNPLFVGRQWLYGEVAEHLASNLPTNKGVVIVGGPGTGKTSLLLKLVEMSCFGRGEPIYQGNSFFQELLLRAFLFFFCKMQKYVHFCVEISIVGMGDIKRAAGVCHSKVQADVKYSLCTKNVES